jgi:hypothetical protein
MFLRLERQAHALSDFDQITGEFSPPLPDFRALMKQHVNPHPLELKLQPGRPSPLCSPSLGASVIHILANAYGPDSGVLGPNIKDDIKTLHEAVQIAINQDSVVIRNGHSMGGDEVLYGRAGLLWALANIDRENVDMETSQALQPVIELKSKLRDAIIDAAKRGLEEYVKAHGEITALALMWPWLDNYFGLGAYVFSASPIKQD